jgi:tetrahydromethanopterin S-methyltransferase subunit G
MGLIQSDLEKMSDRLKVVESKIDTLINKVSSNREDVDSLYKEYTEIKSRLEAVEQKLKKVLAA